MRKIKLVAVFALAVVAVMAAIPRAMAASSTSTIYSFGTTQPIDGGVPKGVADLCEHKRPAFWAHDYHDHAHTRAHGHAYADAHR
jgi:hypothetical protein